MMILMVDWSLPLWKAGSMLPDNTTTIGDSDPVTTINPFQIIKAEDTIMPNDNTCTFKRNIM